MSYNPNGGPRPAIRISSHVPTSDEFDRLYAYVSEYGHDRVYTGRIPARIQRRIFAGLYLGKGEIQIDLRRGRVTHSIRANRTQYPLVTYHWDLNTGAIIDGNINRLK